MKIPTDLLASFKARNEFSRLLKTQKNLEQMMVFADQDTITILRNKSVCSLEVKSL